jgi:hypothetical protein
MAAGGRTAGRAMSQQERTGTRDLLYSRWHRYEQIRRFLPVRVAAMLKAIDVDWCEACHFCNAPVALIETQQSTRNPKPAAVTARLAQMAGIPAFSVSYTATSADDDIGSFVIQRIAPDATEDAVTMEPATYACWLLGLRLEHCRSNPDCRRKYRAS